MPNQIANASGRPIIRAAGAGPVHEVLDVTHTYKALAEETRGLVSVWETAVPPGGGAPHHSHAGEDEAFYVLEGEVTIELDGEARPVILGAGAFVYSPRGVAHAFRNGGDSILRMLVMCLPGGLERMFGEIDAAGRLPRPPDPAGLADLAARHGVTITPRA